MNDTIPNGSFLGGEIEPGTFHCGFCADAAHFREGMRSVPAIDDDPEDRDPIVRPAEEPQIPPGVGGG